MSINIKRNQLKRVVIVGGGLGGLRMAEDLSKANLQVVLIDKNNFHQFPPLIYQIASAGMRRATWSVRCLSTDAPASLWGSSMAVPHSLSLRQ